MTQMGLAGLTTRSELSSIRKLVSQARKRMKYLLDNELAPLTFSWGFIEGPLSKVADYWVPWTKGIHGSVETEVLMATLPTALRKLEPLITPHSRELLLSTRSQWVAYFDNGKHGGDPQSRVGHVCRALSAGELPLPASRTRSRVAAGCEGRLRLRAIHTVRIGNTAVPQLRTVPRRGERWRAMGFPCKWYTPAVRGA